MHVILGSTILVWCPSFALQAAVSSANNETSHILVGEITRMMFRVWYFRTWPIKHRKGPNLKSRRSEGFSQCTEQRFYLNLFEYQQTNNRKKKKNNLCPFRQQKYKHSWPLNNAGGASPHAVENLHITLTPPKLKYPCGISFRTPCGYQNPWVHPIWNGTGQRVQSAICLQNSTGVYWKTSAYKGTHAVQTLFEGQWYYTSIHL